jgi:UDP-GlcNAc:undecaprenyl-phosphate/decaprenyl-phosphate GlcNAc-1-phosphate transferase
VLALCLSVVAIAFVVGATATYFARMVGRRLNAMDSAGVPGQVKLPPRKVPNTGGVGVFLGITLPMTAGLVIAGAGWAAPLADFFPGLADNLPGLPVRTPDALVLLAGLLVLHVVGLIDDRRALGPGVKMAFMVGVALAVVLLTDSRLLSVLDAYVGGRWLSVGLTVLWIVVVTNALNFLDNMDGLSAGVAAIAGVFFMIAASVGEQPQWFIAATIATLVGSLLGFLVFNFPFTRRGASVFMGDSGSLVVGFLLGVLTVRITYFGEDPITGETAAGTAWYGVFMPLIVLAVPLYDFASVVVIRLRQGKSPFVGDLQHFSHRLTRHGLSRRGAVLVIYGCTAATSIAGVSLATLRPWQAALVGVQTLLILGVLALYEWRRDSALGGGA